MESIFLGFFLGVIVRFFYCFCYIEGRELEGYVSGVRFIGIVVNKVCMVVFFFFVGGAGELGYRIIMMMFSFMFKKEIR